MVKPGTLPGFRAEEIKPMWVMVFLLTTINSSIRQLLVMSYVIGMTKENKGRKRRGTPFY
jgi:hypothetical protein